jgi:hypothetical protein
MGKSDLRGKSGKRAVFRQPVPDGRTRNDREEGPDRIRFQAGETATKEHEFGPGLERSGNRDRRRVVRASRFGNAFWQGLQQQAGLIRLGIMGGVITPRVLADIAALQPGPVDSAPGDACTWPHKSG